MMPCAASGTQERCRLRDECRPRGASKHGLCERDKKCSTSRMTCVLCLVVQLAWAFLNVCVWRPLFRRLLLRGLPHLQQQLRQHRLAARP